MAFKGVLRWSEGRWIAVAWQGGFALLAPSAGLPLAELLFSRLRENSELGVFLRTLSEGTGAGLLELPSFAVAIADGDRWHLAVRGALTLRVASPNGNEPLRGDGVATWAERVVVDVTALHLGQVRASSSPLVEGVVLAEGVGFGDFPRASRSLEKSGEDSIPGSLPPDALEKPSGDDPDDEAAPAPRHGPAPRTAEELLLGETLSDAIPASRPRRPEVTEVLSRFCTAGHANPPERARCFVCDEPVEGEPRRAGRPQLGWLKVPRMEPIALLGPIIIGRHPSADALSLQEAPKLLALPYRHVSGNHLAIVLDGWRVLAQDLASRNGTCMRRRAKPPVRLPQRPITLLPGDVIDMGHDLLLHLDRIP